MQQTERETLVDAVLKYQELLVRLGHEQEAQAISASLVAARRAQRRLRYGFVDKFGKVVHFIQNFQPRF